MLYMQYFPFLVYDVSESHKYMKCEGSNAKESCAQKWCVLEFSKATTPYS